MNRAEFIEDAIESVLHQDYKHIEHIIMDGGSTDGTLKLLNKYPHLRVISQPDHGIYDALNKGLKYASGEIIGFLNTDDYYEPDIFGTVIEEFKKNQTADALIGSATLFKKNSQDRNYVVERVESIQQEELLFKSTQGTPIFNAWFFRRRLFSKTGKFSTYYQYAADREFLIRMAIKSIMYVNVKDIFYHYLIHPGSLTIDDRDSGEKNSTFEDRELAESYLDKKDLDPKVRNCFQSWHSQITSDQSITALKNFAFGRSSNYIVRGMRYNKTWPIIFLDRIVHRTFQFIIRRAT